MIGRQVTIVHSFGSVRDCLEFFFFFTVISDATEGRESPDQMVPFSRQYDYQTQFMSNLSQQQQPQNRQKNDEINLKAGEKAQVNIEDKQKDRMEVEVSF
jgi:hypothetical protein